MAAVGPGLRLGAGKKANQKAEGGEAQVGTGGGRKRVIYVTLKKGAVFPKSLSPFQELFKQQHPHSRQHELTAGGRRKAEMSSHV